MPGRPQAIILSMLLSLFVMNDGRTQAQTLPTVRSSRVIETSAQSKTGYFTILGQVAKPGVYETSQKTVSLNDVLKRAGGQTQQSSGSVRVFKGNRVGFRFNLPANYQLASGDVVVIEKKQTFNSTIVQPNQYLQANQAATNNSYGIQQFHTKTTAVREAKRKNHIQLAFVNLLDRPVFVAVNEKDANLPAVVMNLLNQNDPAIVNKVRVIPGEPRPLQTGQAKTELTNGSILVFEKNAVDLRVVPELPEPVQWDANSSTQIASELPGTVTVEESLASNSVGAMNALPIQPEGTIENEIPTIFTQSSPENVQTELPAEPEMADSLPTLNLDQTVADSDASENDVATDIFNSFPEDDSNKEVPPPPVIQVREQSNTAMAMAPLSLEETLPAEEPRPIMPAENTGGLELLPTLRPEAASGQGNAMEVPVPLELVNQDVLPQSNANDLSTVGLLAAFAVVIAVLSVIASAVWSKLDEQSGIAEGELTAEAAPQLYQPEELEIETPRQFIQQLIEDTIPITEEPVEIAMADSLFGEPVASRTYRVDTSHLKESEEYVVPQPHFVNKTEATPVKEPVKDTANVEDGIPTVSWENDLIDSSRYRVDPPDSESMGPSALLERAKDVIQREKQREHRS